MTEFELNCLFVDHVVRAGDLYGNTPACLRVFAKRAAQRGRLFFIYLDGAP